MQESFCEIWNRIDSIEKKLENLKPLQDRIKILSKRCDILSEHVQHDLDVDAAIKGLESGEPEFNLPELEETFEQRLAKVEAALRHHKVGDILVKIVQLQERMNRLEGNCGAVKVVNGERNGT